MNKYYVADIGAIPALGFLNTDASALRKSLDSTKVILKTAVGAEEFEGAMTYVQAVTLLATAEWARTSPGLGS